MRLGARGRWDAWATGDQQLAGDEAGCRGPRAWCDAFRAASSGCGVRITVTLLAVVSRTGRGDSVDRQAGRDPGRKGQRRGQRDQGEQAPISAIPASTARSASHDSSSSSSAPNSVPCSSLPGTLRTAKTRRPPAPTGAVDHAAGGGRPSGDGRPRRSEATTIAMAAAGTARAASRRRWINGESSRCSLRPAWTSWRTADHHEREPPGVADDPERDQRGDRRPADTLRQTDRSSPLHARIGHPPLPLFSIARGGVAAERSPRVTARDGANRPGGGRTFAIRRPSLSWLVPDSQRGPAHLRRAGAGT